MDDPIALHYSKRGNNGMVTLTAKRGDATLYVDKIDATKDAARARFTERLTKQYPGIDKAVVESELLRIAGELAAPPEPAAHNAAPELDLRRIARPELFHTPAVSGLLIPALRISDGEPVGHWELYLRWHADGRREKRALETMLEVPGGALWLHPQPHAPGPTARAGWTPAARQAWLTGAPAPDPGDVFQRVCARFAHYLDFPPDAAAMTTATLALWVLLSYCYPAWAGLPYLSVGGPLGSGKTSLFRVLARLVFRPLESSSLTAALLFRTLHERGGVLLLDEAERLKDGTPEANELRAILLSGYKQGSPAMRLEKEGDTFKHREFDVFGPKAIASIANPPDALASRCIRIGMFRAAPDSPKPRRRIDADAAQWAELRDDLHALALEHGPMWRKLAERADVCPATLGGREFEIWQPLLALAAWLEECGAAGLLELMQRHAEQATDGGREDSTPESDETLLRILAEHVANNTHRALKAGDILRQAMERDAAAFKHLSYRGVAAILKRYGLQTYKSHGEKVYGRVTLDALRSIERAYGLDLGLPAGNAPHVPHVPPNGQRGAETPVSGGASA